MKLNEQKPITEDKKIWIVRRRYLGEYTYEECVSRIIRNHVKK